MIVRQKVINGLPLSAIADKIGVFQRLQLVTDRRRAHPEQLSDGAYAQLRFKKRIQYLHTRIIAENFEQSRQLLDLLRRRHPLADEIQFFFVIMHGTPLV